MIKYIFLICVVLNGCMDFCSNKKKEFVPPEGATDVEQTSIAEYRYVLGNYRVEVVRGCHGWITTKKILIKKRGK